MLVDLESLWQSLETGAGHLRAGGPETPPWFVAMAAAYDAELTHRPEDAAASLEAARREGVETAYDDVLALLALRIDVRRGQPALVTAALASAQQLAERVEQADPATWLRAMHLVGVACIRLGLLERAEEALGRMLSRPLPSPLRTWVVDSFSQTLVGQGAWEEGGRSMAALVAMRRAEGDRTGVAVTGGSLARLYAELGDHERCVEVARDALTTLGDDGALLSRMRLQTFVTMARISAKHPRERIDEEVQKLEALLEASQGTRHYLCGYAALGLSRAAALREDQDAAQRWLETARVDLGLPSQRTLFFHQQVLLRPGLLDDGAWWAEFEAHCSSVQLVTDGEMRIRVFAVERAARSERRATLERAYGRATDSNNPLWIKWVDQLAHQLDPDYLAERVALRFSGSPRGEMERTHREDVTIVFADLVGFTQRAVELDPETVMSTVRSLFELAVPVMLRHRVTPITYMGDGLLAMARGDQHEVRGLEFARRLLGRTHRVSCLRRALGNAWGLDLRAGVASGPVVLGALGSSLKLDFAAIGLTTNLAARLQSSASPGEVVCDERTATCAGIDGPFEELTLKGFEKVGRVRACRLRAD